MNSSNRMSRKFGRDETARYLFMVYKQMSVDRSLKLLAETVRAMGVRISDKTLERYSADYHWQ
jgi:hypothetical protein